MAQLFTNNASGKLSAAIASGDLSLTLQTGQGALFPTPISPDFFYLTLVGTTAGVETSWEIVKVTARSGDVLTIARAQESTTAVGWAINTVCELRLTAQTMLSRAPIDNPIFTGGIKETKVVMAANAIDLSLGTIFTKTITGATTLTVSNIPTTGTVASFILDLTNGGLATITWFSGAKWQAGLAPTLTASGRDVLGFFTHDGGTTWTGLLLGKDVR